MQVSVSPHRGWQFWIDRGGTFTDVIAVAPDGTLTATKLLTSDAAADAAVAGIDRLLAAAGAAGARIDSVRIGTTVGTNALLERRGARTVLVTTAGLGDALTIGSQQRPDLFALEIRLPMPLHDEVVEVRERIGADGSIIERLDAAGLEQALAATRTRGIDSVAIAFLHGYKFPEHERRAARIATGLGFADVSVSHEVFPRARLVERGRTTVVDAYLSPVVSRYARALERALRERSPDVEVTFMQSNGGLIDAGRFRGHNSILSGPAGGVVGMADSASRAGFANAIGFDMGGTSTDVSLHAGILERTDSTAVAGTSIAVPTLRIHTVAAGGGSILDYRDGRLQVGPESAGAEPGPACYGNGGPATLTDANVVLGRIQPDCFPRVFGADGDAPIDADAAARAIAGVASRLGSERRLEPAALAAGAVEIAVDQMAAAIERISIQRGHDPRECALACFGGAGGQHACLVAAALEIETVLIDPLAGVLSAYGIGIADRRTIATRALELPLDDAALAEAAEAIAVQIEALDAAPAVGERRFERRLRLRAGTSETVFAIDHRADASTADVGAEFAAAYGERFGFAARSPIVVDAIEVEAIETLPRPGLPGVGIAPAGRPAPIAKRRAWIGGDWCQAPVYDRERLGIGTTIAGPAIIAEANATTVVETGWDATVDPTGVLVLRRRRAAPLRAAAEPALDPVLLEIFNRRFTHVAEQMGIILEQTAESVNIRERLDYSCALFDHGGALIANAPHVPVHLGSMGDSVRAVLTAFPALTPGDVFVTNAPYNGGTHLPDVTVVTPVFIGGGQRPRFIVASRAHHADIGGISPGSMPATSRTITDEGVLLEPMRLVAGGRLLEDEIRARLGAGPHPARDPDRNVADLKAQIAANGKGVAELGRLIGRYGIRQVEAYTARVQANAEACVRAAVAKLGGGRACVALDGGERIEVTVRVNAEAGSAVVDFTGTSGPSPGNYNAPASIARAVVLYVFRTLVEHDIPLNAGCLVPLEIVLPPGSLLDPRPPAAVVAGNVETSQCIADALLAAVGALAASQGTMNNFTFGDARHQYYETIGGGTGAGPGFPGASAVHSHMTNSRLTDPEILEHRYPVRVRRFGIRRGSGGSGRWQGGDGIVRELEFLAALEGSILANRRSTVPFGLAGGGDGLPGRNYLIRRDGTVVEYGAVATLAFEPGDRFVIETPGGGGYGS